MVENTRMFLMNKFRCVTLFCTSLPLSSLFWHVTRFHSHQQLSFFFFYLPLSVNILYTGVIIPVRKKAMYNLCDSMKRALLLRVTSIQGSDKCFPITAHHSTQRPLYSLYIYPRPPQRDFFLASCITANGEIEIKIRTTERLQIAICRIWLQIHQGRVLLNNFGGEKEQCENWLTS